MYVKRVKRKCSVRGCKHTDCFAMSRTREVGNTVIICRDCLKDALDAIDSLGADEKRNIPDVADAGVPALFFNETAQGAETPAESETKEAPAEEAPAEDAETKDSAEDSAEETPKAETFVCPDCGKEFKSENGLKTHARYCKSKN